MIFNILKKNYVELDLYTHDNNSYEYARIDYSWKYIPEWFKKTDQYYGDEGNLITTIKKCPGFKEYYKKGIAIPISSDIMIEYEVDGNNLSFRHQVSNPNVKITNHPNEQFSKFSNKMGFNVKINIPWLIKLKKGNNVDFSMSDCFWSRNSFDYYIMPGLVRFKYQFVSQINTFVSVGNKKKGKVLFYGGEPLAIYHPMTEKEIILNHHLVSLDDFNNLNNFSNLISNDLRSFKDKKSLTSVIKRSLERKSIKKCPF